MKSDKIEILLEGLTEDVSEIKNKTHVEDSETLKKDIDILGSINLQLLEKINRLITNQEKANELSLNLLNQIKSEITTNSSRSKGIFEDLDPNEYDLENPIVMNLSDYGKPVSSLRHLKRHLKAIVWPFPRLALSLLFSVLMSAAAIGYCYFEYYQPNQKNYNRIFYQDKWLQRAYPNEYKQASSFYAKNKSTVDQETDSLITITNENRQKKIDKKLQELRELEHD